VQQVDGHGQSGTGEHFEKRIWSRFGSHVAEDVEQDDAIAQVVQASRLRPQAVKRVDLMASTDHEDTLHHPKLITYDPDTRWKGPQDLPILGEPSPWLLRPSLPLAKALSQGRSKIGGT
jgi:hypothetical protein